MEDIKLIKATEEDFVKVLALRISTMTEHLEQVGWSMTEEEHISRVRKYYEFGHMIMINGINIGYIKFKENDKAIDIIQFQIDPSHQGKGYGGKVLSEIQTLAREVNKGLSLKVLKANPAKRLYERFGFQIVGEADHEYFMEMG